MVISPHFCPFVLCWNVTGFFSHFSLLWMVFSTQGWNVLWFSFLFILYICNCLAPRVNKPPRADISPKEQTITLPTNEVVLDGSSKLRIVSFKMILNYYYSVNKCEVNIILWHCTVDIIDKIVHKNFLYMITWNCGIGHLSFVVADDVLSSCYSCDFSSIPELPEVINL